MNLSVRNSFLLATALVFPMSCGNFAMERTNVLPSNLKHPYLRYEPLAGDKELTSLITQDGRLLIEHSSDAILKIKNALHRLWYDFPVNGNGREFDAELQTEITHLRRDLGLPVLDNYIDRSTVLAIDQRLSQIPVTKYLSQDRWSTHRTIFVSISLGYCPFDDRHSSDCAFGEDVFGVPAKDLAGDLIQRGYKKIETLDDAERIYQSEGRRFPKYPDYGNDKSSRLDAEQYFVKVFTDRRMLVRIVNAERTNGRRAFLEALEDQDVTIYVGHGRYGTGPDFDEKKKFSDNVIINLKPDIPKTNKGKKFIESLNTWYKLRKRFKKETNLLSERIAPDNGKERYRIWFFDSCWANNFLLPIRKIKAQPAWLDLFGWDDRIPKTTVGHNAKRFIAHLDARSDDLRSFLIKLNRDNGFFIRETDAQGMPLSHLKVEGIGDNPEVTR